MPPPPIDVSEALISGRPSVRLSLSATGGSSLGRGHLPSRFTCCSQIQKLADRSDVISEVPNLPKMLKKSKFSGDPAGGTYSAPQTPN